MTPKYKILYLALGLVLPYWGLGIYMVLRSVAHPQQGLPTWLPLAAGYYLLGSIAAITLVARRHTGNALQQSPERLQATPVRTKAWALYLMVIWAGCFLWGLYKTITGDYPLKKAIPADVLLLSFIVLFSWLWYSDYRARNR